jgi:hypothetical protein
MLGNYRVAAQLVAYRVVLSSTQLVSGEQDGPVTCNRMLQCNVLFKVDLAVISGK